MKKALGLFLCCLLVSSVCQAQKKKKKLNIDWAIPTQSNLYTYINPIGIQDNDYYFIDMNYKVLGKGQVDLYKCDVKKPRKMDKETISEKDDNRFELGSYGGVSTGEEGFIYKKFYDKSSKTMALELIPFDDKLRLSNKSTIINKLPESKHNDLVYTVTATSPNGEYTVIHSSSIMTFKFSDYMRVYPGIGFIMAFFPRSTKYYRRPNAVTVLDKDGDVVWEKSFFLGEKKSQHKIYEVHVTDEGDVIMFGDDWDNRTMMSSSIYEWNYAKKYEQVYYLSERDDEPTITNFDWGDDMAVHSMYFIVEGDEVHCAASLSKVEKRKSDFYGAKVMRLNYETGSSSSIDIPMDYTFFKTELSKKEQRRVDKGKDVPLGYPIIRYLSLREDGNYVLCIEERTLIKKQNTTTYSDGSSRTTVDYDYLFENAAVFEANEDGEVNWKYVVEKYQYLGAKYLQGSLFITEYEGDMMMFFNDGKDGKFRDSDKNRVVHVIKLDDKGDEIYNAEVINKNPPIMPEYCRTYGDKVCLTGHDKKNHGVGFFDLDQ